MTTKLATTVLAVAFVTGAFAGDSHARRGASWVPQRAWKAVQTFARKTYERTLGEAEPRPGSTDARAWRGERRPSPGVVDDRSDNRVLDMDAEGSDVTGEEDVS